MKKVPTSGPVVTPDGPTPDPTVKDNGQYKSYWVLSPEERAKGFVRPVRYSYCHVGTRPQYPTRELTPEEKELHAHKGYVLYEKFPESESPKVGRFWTREQLESGCNTITTMSREIAESYARNPKFYGSTFCVACKKHLPVDEFVWTGTTEKVGS